MEIRLTLPRLQSLSRMIGTLCVQFLLFVICAYLLYTFYNPSLIENWEVSWHPYPYVLFELALLLGASLATFWIFRWDKRTAIRLFLGELGVFIAVAIISASFTFACGSIFSLVHHPGLGKPNCGVSSLNPYSGWFIVFLVLTLVLWHVMLSARRDHTVLRPFGTLRVVFEKAGLA